MPGSGAALTRANAALSSSKSLSTNLASIAPGADGASHVASGDTTGGMLWTTMAGFITALLGGQVTHSLPSRAQMIANHVPAAVATILTSGFATAGDGGAATYVRAAGPFADGSSFQSADGAWWKLSMPAVNLTMFGAVGGTANQGIFGTLPDDTAAIQAAVSYASANGVTLRIPARHYRFTKSINGGKANANDFHTLRIIGEGFYSKLVADLTEAYPAIDLTNQRDGCIEYLGFDSTTTSLHTCMFLMAETTPSFVNGFRFNFCQAVDEGASSHYLLYGLSADQMMIDNCNWITLTTAGAACVYVGPLNPYSISSKFWTIIETSADLTVFSAHNSNFLAASGPALWLQEIIGIQLTNTYFGVIGTTGHAMGMLRIGSNGAGYSTQVVCTNFRTEDHASGGTTLAQVTGAIAPTGDGMTSTLTATATTTGAIAVGMVLTGTGVKSGTVVLANVSTNVWLVSNIQTVASGTLTSQVYSSPAIYFEDYVRESILQGQASTIGAGAIGGPGQQINTTASIGCTFGLFNNAGALLGGRFHCYGSSGLGGQGYGGLFDQVNSHSYVIGGDLGGAAAAIPAYAATASEFSDFGTNEPGAGTPHKYLNYQTRVFAPGGNTPVNYRIAVQGESGVYNAFNGGTYTGGSGMVQMGGPLISAAFLRYNAASSSDLVYPAREIIIEGMFNSNWAAAGQMRVDLQQTPASGTKYTTLCTLTGIPAYGAATGYRITISCYWNGSGWFLHTKIETFGSAPVSAVNIMGITSQGFDATSSAPLLVIPFLSNAGNTPVTYATFYKVV